MFRFKLFVSAFLFTLMLSGLASAGLIIHGFIVDSSSDEPLPVANVLLEGMGRGATTNLDGYFVVDDLKPGVYRLLVSYLGYEDKIEEVVVTNQPMKPIKIELNPQAVQLQEVIVEAERNRSEEIRLSPQVSTVPLNNMTLRRLPSLAAEQDVLRTLQTIPGVKASSDISSALYVRGGSPDQTLILMDHNPVYNPAHMFGLFSTFNASAVKHLDLMKGGFPAEYGGRSGSVLEIITEEGNRKEFEGDAEIGVVSAKASIQGPLPKDRGSYFFAGRRTYLDPLLTGMRNAYDIDLPDYYFYDGNGKINLDLSNHTTLTTAGYWGLDNLDFEAGPSDSRVKMHMDWGNRTISSRLRHVVSPRLFFSTGLAVSRYESNWYTRNEEVLFEEALDRIVDYSLKTDLEYLYTGSHRFKTGIWISRYDFTLDMGNDATRWVDIDTTAYNYSWYLQDKWTITPQWEILPGVRMTYHSAGEHFRVDPRMSLMYRYDDKTRFKLSGGRYSQWIQLITFGEGFSSFDIWTPIDGSMKPSYTNQIILGFEHEPKKDLEFTFETYYTDMHDIVQFNYVSTEQSAVAADAYIFGEGKAYGFEWMLRKTAGRLSGWIGYSLSFTQRRFPGTYVNDGDWFYPKWDRRHDFIAVGYYELNDKWDLSGSWRYNTGQSYTQPLGIYTLPLAGVDPSYIDNGGRYPVYGEMNNYRYPADHRLDFTATYKHKFFGLPARLNLSVYNVYSRRAYWIRSVDTKENPAEIVDFKLLPVLPLFSYEVRF